MPLAAAVPAIIGGVAGLGGAALSANASKKAAQTMADAQKQATTTLGGSTIYGPGGQNASLYENGSGGTFNLGDMEGSRDFLNRFGSTAFAQMPQGVPPQLQQLMSQMMYQGQQPVGANDQLLNFMEPALRGQFNSANQQLAGLGQNGFQRGLQNTAFAGAGNQLGIASQDPSAVRDQTLSLLRQQAQPEETRAWQQLQQDQFGTGRMGTTGGGIQTEAFARGLGQADLSRQLMAGQEGRNYQQNALGLGQGLAGVGGNVAGLESQLLQNAFSNFGNTMGLGANLSGQGYNQRMGSQQNSMQMLNQLFGNQVNMAQLPTALQGNQLNLGMQALQGQMGLQGFGMDQLAAALGMSQAGANARIGSGSNVAALAGARAGMPTSGDMWGNALTGIGTRLAGNEDFSSMLGRILPGRNSGYQQSGQQYVDTFFPQGGP
jgi:hypothetical protein